MVAFLCRQVKRRVAETLRKAAFAHTEMVWAARDIKYASLVRSRVRVAS